MVTGKKNDEYINENPVIKKAKETNKVTVVQTTPNPVNIEITKFMIDHKKVKEDYKEIFNGSGAKNRNGRGRGNVFWKTASTIPCSGKL